MDTDYSPSPTSFKAHLLVAMPQMGDPRFHRAVIFLCVHDEKGAMGLTINHPLHSVTFPSLLGQLGITADETLDLSLKNMPVLSGGPVEDIRGFLLHTPDFHQKDTIVVDDQFHISGTLDSLRMVVQGTKPDRMLFALGYAGWGTGQLEQELQDNAWMVVPATQDLVFNTPAEDMWEKALAALGVDPALLSGVAGNA